MQRRHGFHRVPCRRLGAPGRRLGRRNKRKRRIVHAKALSALKPGGLIVLEAFRPEQTERHASGARGGPRDASLLYSVADLEADFAAAEILLREAAEARVDDGGLRQGESAVVRAAARKR